VVDLGPPESNAVARAYSVYSPPDNFLIGPDGKIAARNVQVTALSAKVKNLLRDSE
jgi:hypothetical protein